MTSVRLLCAFLLSASSLVGAQDQPPLPITIDHLCPFECCRFGAWTAGASVRAYAERDLKGATAFRIERGAVVTALDGLVIVAKAGIMRVNKTTQFDEFTAEAGAIVYVLRATGEGSAKVWFRGRVHNAEAYAETVHSGNDAYPWDIVSLPQSTWWVRVRNSRGEIGWLADPNGFEGMDGCLVRPQS